MLLPFSLPRLIYRERVAVMPEWRVRRLKPADVPAVLAILQAGPGASHWAASDYEPACRGEHFGILVEGQGSMAGFLVARAAGGELEILNMAVRPEFRRQGLGSLLLEEALAHGRACRAQQAFLEVRASNRAAIAFYVRHGFLDTGRRPRYYSDPVEDARVLFRTLA